MAEYCEYCMQPVTGGSSCPFCGNRVCGSANENWQLQPGTVLQGRYLLGRVLGAGGFGITYIGRDLRLNRRIAVKEYFPKAYASRVSAYSPVVTITDDQSYFANKGKDNFIREAQALATLPRNLGVVEVYDYFEDNGTAYIVMEYLEGSTLKQLLQRRRFGADELFSLLEPVLEALEAVHRSNLVHRDISPDNLMLCGDGKLVLMDFGAARQVNTDNPQSMTLMVKHGYAPEEQYRVRGEVGPWTDIYALCATIYHCITGIVPVESNERLVCDTLRWPSETGIAITPVQEAVLKKGMAVRAADRFRSVAELRAALQKKAPPVQAQNPTPSNDHTTATVLLREEALQQAGIKRLNTDAAGRTEKETPARSAFQKQEKAPIPKPWEAATSTAARPTGSQSQIKQQRPSAVSASENDSISASGKKTIAIVAAVAITAVLILVIILAAVVFSGEKHTTVQEGETNSAEQVWGEIASDAPAVAEVGGTVFFGNYEQDNDTTNGAEAIEWIVLDKDGDNVLLLSKYALDAQPYNEEFTDVTWETCSLRSWLNNEFYTTAFSAAEQSRIKTTTVTAAKNPDYSTSPGNDTQDKVFLLSIQEAKKYFSSDEERMCVPTSYAIANGAYTNDDYTVGGKAACWWWLRSPGYGSSLAALVSIDGWVNSSGFSVRNDDYCIRPALWVNLAS